MCVCACRVLSLVLVEYKNDRMSASNVLSTLRRSSPSIVDCFRNARLYRRETVEGMVPPPTEMVVLFTWLGAKQKYAHKYANCWTRRGYDVLHVTCSVRDLLFPRSGAEVTASRVVDFLTSYDRKVIVHGLSVGGYLTQRVLIDAKDSPIHISHQIFDSFTNVVGIEKGVQNAVHPHYRTLATKCMKVYSKYADLSSILEAQKFVTTTPCPAPALFVHSMADQVASYEDTEEVINAQRKVAPVDTYVIPAERKVPHVTIMKYMGEQNYMGLIHNFVERYRGAVISSQNDFDLLTNTPPAIPQGQPKLVLPQ